MAAAWRTNTNWAGLAALVAVSIANCYFIVKNAKSNYIHRRSDCTNASCNHFGSPSRRGLSWAQKSPGNLSESPVSRLADYELVRHASSIPNLDAYMKFYYSFSLLFNIYYAIKHLIIILLDFETFREYRYLDCYLMGRLCLDVRVVGMANLFACFISSFHVLWALIIHLRPHNFQLPFLEFLLHNEEEVSYWDDRFETRTAPPKFLRKLDQHKGRRCDSYDSIDESSVYYSSLFDYFSPPTMPRRRSKVLITLNDRFPLERGEPSCRNDQADLFKLRPNRSLDSWRKLSRTCSAFSVLCLAIASTIHLTVWWWSVPLVLFKSGYELSHGNCVRYIADQIAANNGTVNLWIDHRLIFDPPDPNNYQSPDRPTSIMSLFYDYQLVDLNWYHTTRALVCFLELIVFYTELHSSFTSKAIVSIVMTSDISNYCTSIRQRLGELVGEQRKLSFLRTAIDCKYNWQDCIRRTRKTQMEESIRSRASELQAMIADMFELIDNYNRYASIQVSFLIALWLFYSALVSGWMFLPVDKLPKAEWYVLHGFATVYLFVIMVPFAKVRRECTRMHQQMSIAMALDEDYRGGKRMWLALLRFFKPVPMYCFTIRRDVEMSMLFALKLLAWLFTALSVVSSFFIFRCPSPSA